MRKTTIALIALVLAAMPLSALATETDPIVLDPTLNPQLPAGVVMVVPTADPVADHYSSGRDVELAAAGMQSIHYTTDGVDPTCTTGTTYAGAIDVDEDMTIEAVSCYNGHASNKATFAYDIGGGGGGGGGSSTVTTEAATIASLTAELNRLIALLAQMQAASGVTPTTPATPGVPGASACPYVWTRTLDLGASGADVMKLQQFLNYSADTRLGAAAGSPGSPGYETTLYGSLTAGAVSKFQVKYTAEILTPIGLTAPTGKFGEMSRAKANALCI